MSIFAINIRTEINNRRLKYYINRFLNSELFKGRYVLVELHLHGEKEITQVGDQYYLNLSDSLELKTFIFIVQQNYHSSNIEDKIREVVFKFKDLKKAEYTQNKN